MTCPNCGHENQEDARFCSQCATPLAPEAAPREERKVVTVLFCDLVGFTSRAEQLDPEDVRAVLSPYHARLRAELERFGGTVEKFIGDAVMAVFGAPTAHEDDPERAVRAALAIRDWAADEDIELRIAVNTGEALVTVGAEPLAAGDVVNTAARLESAAPPGGILVGEVTYRATRDTIDFEIHPPIAAKGKSEPVTAWQAKQAKARVKVEREGRAPLVGRQPELALVRETLARVKREREPQLVTLVGVPGIGKSRLVYELFQTIERGPDLVYWRHGRSLPYGDGVTFWALSEMVKAQAGILESDGPELTAQKLREAVERFVDDSGDAARIERNLRTLLGLEAEEEWAGNRRDEAFAAWRHYLEVIADERPLVLVFEDLHWADEQLLDFVDHLVDWASGVPLLVLATARPELLVRRPGWGGGKVNSSTILLSALSEEETTSLLHALLGRSAVDADLQSRLLEHAGGNPLYAEEFVRMVAERPGEAVLPETVQGIIAARLDTLPAEEKELLQDAAVMGRTFWLGALGGERWTLEERLHTLERKEFVRRERRSAVAGESEFSFRHALVREVAYEQIPRAQRAEKHRRTAEWIASLGRADDHAEMLAHHYLHALELARASGQPVAGIAEQARDILVDAGDRAASLSSFETAARFYGEGLELGGLDGATEADVRLRRARALYLAGDDGREVALEEARQALLATDHGARAAEADALLAELWWHRGDRVRSSEHLDRAQGLVQNEPVSPSKARVLGQVSRYRMLAGANEEAIRIGREVLAMAETLDLQELRAHALNNVGTAKTQTGDFSGLADIERSLDIALAVGSPEAARAYNNLGVSHLALGDMRRAIVLVGEAMDTGQRLGNVNIARFSRTFRLWMVMRTGAWDETLPVADEFIAACEAGEPHYHESGMRVQRAMVRLARDDLDGAVEDVQKAVPLARSAGDPQNTVPTLAGSARVLFEAGRRDEALELAREALGREAVFQAIHLPWVASDLGCDEEVAAWLGKMPASKWRNAGQAVVAGDFLAAAAAYEEIGDPHEESRARLRAAEQLVAEGRRVEADEQLGRALAFWRSVRATRYIREAESLLAAAS